MTTRILFTARGLPVLQNRVFAEAAAAVDCPTGDMVLAQHLGTGLVFNTAFDPGKLRYDSDYQNEQALSPTFQSHLDEVIGIIGLQFEGRPLLEVGCGKAYLLERLQALGWQITGVDPAYEGNNPAVIKSLFQRELGLSADCILLRHVLEHVQDPLGFLAAIATANGGKGAIYIEVPCFDWICARRAWFDIFYEHVNYFRLRDFYRMFGTVHSSGHLFGGQYLYVVADLASLRQPVFEPECRVDFPGDFLAGVERAAEKAQRSPSNAIWGGSSKGVTFAIHMQRAGVEFRKAVDINPVKQGRHLPVTGLQVVSPEDAGRTLDPGSTMFIMNSNYTREIVAQSQNRFHYYEVDR